MPTRLSSDARERARVLRNLRVIDRRALSRAWEPTHLRRVFDHCQVDCVLDVGANFGQYADMLRKRVKFDGLIVSFEPNPVAAQALRDRARGVSNWVVEEVAIADHDGTATFNLMRDPEFSSLSSPRHDEEAMFVEQNVVDGTVEVRTERLVTTLGRLRSGHQFARPFLKLDTQGSDVEIVRAAGSAMQEFVGLQSELAVQKLYENSVDFREALSLYQTLGFELSALVPNNDGHFPRLIEIDCIMVRRDLTG